jgi:hypothetical protein
VIASLISASCWTCSGVSASNTADPTEFPRFMSDRAAVERFRSQVELYVGAVTGPDPADPSASLGRTPGRF